MSLIQCSESCKFQADGYCKLEKCSVVTSTDNSCPYFVERLFDNRNSLSQASYPDKL